MVTVMTILFVVICPVLVFIVLSQDSKGGGLAGVLGGAGASSAFGAKTMDVILKTTIVLGILYFALAILLGMTLKSDNKAPGAAGLLPDVAPIVDVEADAPVVPADAPVEAPAPEAAPVSETAVPEAPAAESAEEAPASE